MLARLRSIIDLTTWEQPPGTQPLGPHMPPTWHRLELLLRGRAWCRDSGREIEVGPGWLVWDGPGETTLHRTGADGFAAFLVTVEVERGAGRDGPRAVRWGTAAAARALAGEYLGAWGDAAPGRFETGVAAFARLRFDALRVQGASGLPGPLRLALERIERDAHTDLGVGHLAKAAGLSQSRLHALFAAHLGTTPYRRLLHERLARARARLVVGDEPLTVVATTTGFADAATLCRVFRRELGVSPGAYRTLNRQPPARPSG